MCYVRTEGHMNRLRLSIRWRMTLLFAVLLATILVLTCIIIVFSTRQIVFANLAGDPSATTMVATLNRQLGSVIIPCLIGGLLLVLGIGRWFAGLILRPIAHITATAHAISTSADLSQRIGPVPVAWDEVGQLAATVDAMLATLDRVFTTQQQFVADASHELRTPLTAILGHANLIRRQGKAHPEIIDEATSALIEEAWQMHRLVQDLLTLEQINGRMLQRRQPVVLSDLIESATHDLESLAVSRNVGLVLPQALAPTMPLVWGDPDQLRQVIVNVVENALKFTPAGGRVAIVMCPVRLRQAEAVKLSVSDSGCGIASADLPFIFDRFYRAEKSRTTLSGGSGLGLAIVQNIVQQHNGTVDVVSEVDCGTTICIVLPGVRQS